MSMVVVDTSLDCCVVSFFIPRDVDTLKYLKGRVIVSCQEGINPGDGVLITGGAAQFILNNEGELYLATNIIANERKRRDDDPKWFVVNIDHVDYATTPATSNVAAVAQLESIKGQLETVIDQLG